MVSGGGFLAGRGFALCIHSVWPEADGLAIISHADGSLRVARTGVAAGDAVPRCIVKSVATDGGAGDDVLFNSNVGRHRDNFSSRDLHRWLETGKTEAVGHTVSADTNSQVLESDVLLWAEGNTGMVITLSFPRPADRFGKRDAYIVHPAFRFTSERGTLFVFKWQDDLFFCHQADFDKAVLLAAGAAGYRFVFVFRWLQSTRTFNCGSAVAHIPRRTSTTTASASANMIPTDELVEKERVRQGTKRRRAESDRRAACQIGV